MKSRIQQLCFYLYSAFSIPTIYVSSKKMIVFEFPEINSAFERVSAFDKLSPIFAKKKNLALVSLAPSRLWGKISIKESDDYIVVGPLKNNSFISSEFKQDLFEEKKSFEYRSLNDLPVYNVNSALHLFTFINYIVNDEIIPFGKSLANTEITDSKNTYSMKTYHMIDRKENETWHNTYHLELEMLDYIKRGEKEKLVNFLETKMSTLQIRAGKMADSTIRQEKNIFLAILTKVGNQAAIPGGMNVEEAYELIDTYSIQCESSSSIEEIAELHHRMLLDFCENVHQSKTRINISLETQKIIDFIKNRTNMPITLNDIVDYTGKSKSYLCKHFKNDVGMSINNFIKTAKLNESKDLLKYTEMSISEIANYLSFANQSHFQNNFKSLTGETPNNYRKKKKRTLLLPKK